MKNVLKALLTLWYAFLAMAFIFGVFVSIAVLLGVIADTPSAPYVGIFCTVVFWMAASRYRKAFLERIEKTKKADLSHWDDDDQ